MAESDSVSNISGPSQVVEIYTPAGLASSQQRLAESNTLLRAAVILLCSIVDVDFDDIMTLAQQKESTIGLPD